MSDGKKISKERYLYYHQIGVPYEGEVEGLGHAFTKPVVNFYPANKSGTERFYNASFLNMCVVDSVIVDNTNHNKSNYAKNKEAGGWVQRGDHIFYDRAIFSQEDVKDKYGKKAKFLPEGTKIESYTLYNVNKGTVKDKDGNVVDNSERIYSGQYIIFGTCDSCLNAGTLYENWFFNSSFIGPNNPKVYLNNTGDPFKNWSYDFNPKRLSEYPAIRHDIEYDMLKLAGIKDALFATEAIGADMRLVIGETFVFFVSNDPVGKLSAAAVAVGFSHVVRLKAVIWLGEKAIEVTKNAVVKTKNAAFDFYINANSAIERAVNPFYHFP